MQTQVDKGHEVEEHNESPAAFLPRAVVDEDYLHDEGFEAFEELEKPVDPHKPSILSGYVEVEVSMAMIFGRIETTSITK